MSAKKLKLGAFILMILTSVFGVTNIGIGFYRMGYAAIPMFVIGGLANSTSKCNSRLKIRLLSEVRQKPPVVV